MLTKKIEALIEVGKYLDKNGYQQHVDYPVITKVRAAMVDPKLSITEKETAIKFLSDKYTEATYNQGNRENFLFDAIFTGILTSILSCLFVLLAAGFVSGLMSSESEEEGYET